MGYLSLIFLMSCLDCIKFLKPSMRSTSPEVIQHPSRLGFKTQQVLQGYIYRFAEQRGSPLKTTQKESCSATVNFQKKEKKNNTLNKGFKLV